MAIQTLQYARAELGKARASIEEMHGAKSLSEFEGSWKDFLHKLERVWNKAVNVCGKNPRFNGWKGKYEKLRREDELLAYFTNARDAEEHTVAEITAHQPGGVGIKPSKRSRS